MSQDEHLPEELNDCQRMLASLAPRASRIDRDRLMIHLGEQSAARGSTPWKWATGASLMLAFVLGLRPAILPQGAAPAHIVSQNDAEAPGGMRRENSRVREHAEAPHAVVRPIGDEADWLLSLASGRFDASRPLTVRPQLATDALAARAADARVPDDSPDANPPPRTPTLRWGDRRLRRDGIGLATPPTS